MNQMADMRMKTSDKKKSMMAEPMREDYPYGLRISLNHEQIEKIKNCKNLNAGDTVHIVCEGTVSSKEVRDREKEGEKHSMDIQIKKISLNKAGKGKINADKIMYGGKRNVSKMNAEPNEDD